MRKIALVLGAGTALLLAPAGEALAAAAKAAPAKTAPAKAASAAKAAPVQAAKPAPAEAPAPNLGKGWSLVSRKRVRVFVPDLGKNWAFNGSRHMRYFVPADQTDKETERDLSRSEIADRSTERTPVETTRVRVEGQAANAVAKVERKGKASRKTRREGRNLVTYDLQPVDVVRVTTTEVPYKVVEALAWKERERVTYRNTYRTRTKLSWAAPGGTQRLEKVIETVEGPFTEIGFKSWVEQQETREAGAGKDVSTREEVVESRVQSRVAEVAPVREAATDVDPGLGSLGERGGDIGSSTAAVGGSGQVRTAGDAAAARRLLAADRIKAQGRSQSGLVRELLAAAETQPVLFDEAGRKAFKLGRDGDRVTFTAFDDKGRLIGPALPVSATGLSGSGEAGVVEIRSFQIGSGGSLKLHGEFWTPAIDLGARSKSLASR